MGDFRKNISHRLISKENNSRKETPGGKNSFTEKNSFVAYNSGNKSYTCKCQKKKILTLTKLYIPTASVER